MSPTPSRHTAAVDTPAAAVWVGPEGVHRLRFKPVARLTLADVEALQRARVSLGAAGRGRLVLVELAHRPLPTPEAAAYAKRPEVLALTAAMALVTPNALVQAFGNAFLGVLRPDYPTRLFRHEADALAWLLARPLGPETREPAASGA